MRDIVLRMGLLDDFDDTATDEVIGILLEAYVQVNEIWWREHPDAPPLYTWGVNYQREPKGTPETWVAAPWIWKQRTGIDCDDWAPARAGELRARFGEMARAITRKRKIRGKDGRLKTIWHVIVEREDGTIEDPSAVLGMLQQLPEDAHERRAAIILRLAHSGHQRTRDLVLEYDRQARMGDAGAAEFMRLLARVNRAEKERHERLMAGAETAGIGAGSTSDQDRAEAAAARLHNYIRAANINGMGSVEETDDGRLRLRATLYDPTEDDLAVVRRVPEVDGLAVRIVVIGRVRIGEAA